MAELFYMAMIMDYEKMYKEALERAKTLHENANGTILKKWVKQVFPELAESEDERIRKALLELVHDTTGDSLWVDYNVHKEEVLSWLEKQGELADEYEDKLDRCTCESFNKGYKAAIEHQKEKQGEQKPAEWHSEDEQNLNACLGYIPDEFLRRWLMDVVHVKYDKFADKVEPKFKVGDWIIFNQNHNSIYQVERIDKYRYYLRHYLGGTLSVHFDIELIRQWNIQDAKDGDVLVCNEEILLFKSYSVQGRISLYCWYNGQTNNFHSKSITDTSLTTRNKICPATKEQRDTLFEKMKEAGWKWDEEKKELCKIKHEPKWTEEDEKRLQSCISSLQGKGLMGGVDTINTRWLKSLKQRMEGK